MPKAVRYDGYGGLEVLRVVEVDRPVLGPGQVLVRVKGAGNNPGEANLRKGELAHIWHSTFPFGQGSELAGIVEEIGEGAEGFAVGDERCRSNRRTGTSNEDDSGGATQRDEEFPRRRQL
jgi:NADPH:quinone reductase-like Zn-dependent oxidoreductase